MGVMSVMGGYLGGGREYLEGGSVGVDPSVWVPPFWDDAHLPPDAHLAHDAHLHDPSMADPPPMGEVGGGDLMDAFPPQQQHGESNVHTQGCHVHTQGRHVHTQTITKCTHEYNTNGLPLLVK